MQRVPFNRVICFVSIAVLGVFIDLYSKYAVFHSAGNRAHQSSLWVKSWFNGGIKFRFYTSFNEGALWGLGQGYTFVFAFLSVLAAIAVVYWLFWRGAAQSWWLTVTLAFVLAGTIGNLYDRLGLYNYSNAETGEPIYAVRDFLLFTFGTYHWPVFNIADVCLVTGAIMLFIASFVTVQPDEAETKTPPSPS